jgi:hypothetical protein
MMVPSVEMPSVELMLVAGRAAFLIFSFVIAAVSFARWRRVANAQTGQVLALTDIVLQRLAGIEARIDAAQSSISQLGERVDRPQHAVAATAAPGYQIAIRLAKSGASREELMSGCGLSLLEAELVQRLHAPAAHAAHAAHPTHTTHAPMPPDREAAHRRGAELRLFSVIPAQADLPQVDSGRTREPLASARP